MTNLLTYYLGGLLMGISPCCLPMIPILLTILIGDTPISSKRRLLLTGSFIISSIIIYALLGLVGALMGIYIQSAIQMPIILIPMAILMVLLALIQLEWIPLSLSVKLQNIPIKRNSVLGASLLGLLGTITLSPCVTPLLIGLLTFISTSHNLTQGILALIMVGLGANTPLLLLSTVGINLLSKLGDYMNHVKTISAIVLLGLAGTLVYKSLQPVSISRTFSAPKMIHQVEKKVLIFVTSPTCEYCKSVESAIQQGAAKGWDVQRVRTYPGAYGTPTLIKLVNGKEVGKLAGGPRTYNEIKHFVQEHN